MNDMAKVFWSGRSQAVRLPKAFRFAGNEVRISRDGNKVILEADPLPEDGAAWVKRMSGCMDESWARAIEVGHLGPEHLPDGPSFD